MTFIRKYRGDSTARILADYECPEHGPFELVVSRGVGGDPPDEVPCPAEVEGNVNVCGLTSSWTIGAPRIRHPAFLSTHRGQSDEKPFPTAMDTEPLADGKVTLQEWKKQRAEMWHRETMDEYRRNTR